MRRARGRSGFTLLEVVVALAILALSLMAIFDLNSGAIASHAYAKRLTIATMLARSKMEDLKQNLYDNGFDSDDQELDGDFGEEGWESFKWKAKILAPRTGDLSPDQLMGALFGLPAGEGGLDALFSGAGMSKSAKDQAAKGGPVPDAMAAAGPLAGMAQAQMQQLVTQINQSVREIRLTVTWPDGKREDSLEVVTHLVATGPGSDRNGGAGAGAAGQPGTFPNGQPIPQGPFVNVRTGQPVAQPLANDDGEMIDPNHPGDPVVPVSQYHPNGGGNPLPVQPGVSGGGR